jgi:hypothetical protein
MAVTKERERIVRHLFPRGEDQDASTTYVILDAARDDAIYRKIKEAGRQSGRLYYGSKGQEMADVAPYLIDLKQDDPFAEWVINRGWGNSWGIFLESSVEQRLVMRHLRRFLLVYDENHEQFYFRFYDPRVLRVYLPTCRPKELETFFGPIKRYCLESEEGNLIEFRRTDKFQLMQNVVKLQG